MSIKIMSAIFASKFMDLKDAAGNVTKASTARQILLVIVNLEKLGFITMARREGI